MIREVAQRYGEFSRQLAALNLQVAQLALSPRHAWQLRPSSGMVLELGAKRCSSARRGLWRYTRQPGGAGGFSAIVDMRYRNGFAVGGMVKLMGWQRGVNDEQKQGN
jgi:cell division protein FtsQ